MVSTLHLPRHLTHLLAELFGLYDSGVLKLLEGVQLLLVRFFPESVRLLFFINKLLLGLVSWLSGRTSHLDFLFGFVLEF